MNSPISRIAVIAMLVATAVISLTLTNQPTQAHETTNNFINPCSSGKMTARLTGWILNNMIPKGNATYDEATKELKISLLSVKLDDGTLLTIETKKDKLGEVTALKDGKAEIALTVEDGLKEKDRIRVIEKGRPIVSGNLVCAKPETVPTKTRTPTPTPMETPSPTPLGTPEPAPTPMMSPTP